MSEEKNISLENSKSQIPGPTKDSQGLQPQTTNDKPETEMEVHKHPHNVKHKKKWEEYLLEFLMLFLAVFLGFLAENQRESMIEHRREQQYAKQLLADLRKDSAFFKRRAAIVDSTFEKSWLKELFEQQEHPADAEIIRGFL